MVARGTSSATAAPTVRQDYRVEAFRGGSWKIVAVVKLTVPRARAHDTIAAVLTPVTERKRA